jgi:hypothetical protein
MNQSLSYFLRFQYILILSIVSTAAHAQIYLYQKDGLLGLENYTDSSIITAPVYDKIEFFCSIEKLKSIKTVKANFWIVWKEDLCGVVNSKGKEIIPMMRATIYPQFLYGYIHYRKDNNNFLADTSGKLILKTTAEFQQRSKFIYYRDDISNKTKIINYAGTEVLATDCYIRGFDDEQDFFYGYATGIEGMGLFNLSGKCIASGDYDNIEFSGPYILCRNYVKNSTNVVYDRKLKLLYKGACNYNYMKVINEEYLSAGCDDNYFIMDSTGRNFPVKGSSIKKFVKEYFLASSPSDKKGTYKLYFYDGRLAFNKSITNVKEYGDRYIVYTNKDTYILNDAGTIIKTMNDIKTVVPCAYPYIICFDEMNTYIANMKDGSISVKIPQTYETFGYREILYAGEQFYIKVFDTQSASFGLRNFQGELVLPFQYQDIKIVDDIIVAKAKNGRTSYFSLDLKILYNGIAFNDKQDLIPGFIYADRAADNGLTVYDRNAKVLFRAERPANTSVYKGYYIVSNVYPGNKMGIFGMDGEVLVKPQYDAIEPLKRKYWIVKENNAYGVIDMHGNEIIPMRYQSASFSEDLLKLKKDDHITAYRVTSDTLYEVLNTTYPEIEAIGTESTYFIIKENGKFGIINNKGTVVPPIYEKISRMYNGMLLLKKNDSTYFSSYTNPPALTGPYTDFKFSNTPGASDKNKDLIVRRKTQYGIVNNQGKVLLDAVYTAIYYKNNDLYIVTRNKKSAIFFKDVFVTPMDIDSIFYITSSTYENTYFYRNGNYYLLLENPSEKISAPYSKIQKYNGKYVIVKKDATYGILTNQNVLTLDIAYQNIKPAGPSGELIIQQHGLYGMASEKGDIRIPTTFDTVQYLYKSAYYRVRKNNMYGIYDQKGRLILPAQYEFIESPGQFFLNQYLKKNPGDRHLNLTKNAYVGIEAKPNQFIVKQHNLYGVIDSSQTILIPIQYDFIADDDEGYMIKKDKKAGYADHTGMIIVSAAYDSVSKVSDINAFYIYQHQKCGVFFNSKMIIQPQYDRITYDTERYMYTMTRNDSSAMADTSGKICLPLDRYKFLIPNNDTSYCFIKNRTDTYAIFSFVENKLLTPFIYRSIQEQHTDQMSYFMLYARETRSLSIYVPGTEGAPPKAIYEKIIYNEDNKCFELYYKSKDGTLKYRTYAPKGVLSKSKIRDKNDDDDDN